MTNQNPRQVIAERVRPGAMVRFSNDSVIIAGWDGWRYHQRQRCQIRPKNQGLIQKLEANWTPD